MNRNYLRYIISDLLSKGLPVITLLLLGATLASVEVKKVETIYQIQGLLINVLTFGQVYIYSRSLSFQNTQSNGYILYVGCLLFLIYGLVVSSPILILASIASIFQINYNLLQIKNNLIGELRIQQINDSLNGLLFSLTLILLVLFSGLNYYTKVLTQILAIFFILLYFRKSIYFLNKELFQNPIRFDKNILTFIILSIIQWGILYFDKYSSREYLNSDQADSYFLFTLITSSGIVLNLSVLKAIRYRIHTNRKLKTSKISLKELLIIISIILIVSLGGIVFLQLIGEELLPLLFIMNIIVSVLFSVMNYLITVILQGVKNVTLKVNQLFYIFLFTLCLVFLNLFMIKSIEVYIVICITTLITINLLLYKNSCEKI